MRKEEGREADLGSLKSVVASDAGGSASACSPGSLTLSGATLFTGIASPVRFC